MKTGLILEAENSFLIKGQNGGLSRYAGLDCPSKETSKPNLANPSSSFTAVTLYSIDCDLAHVIMQFCQLGVELLHARLVLPHHALLLLTASSLQFLHPGLQPAQLTVLFGHAGAGLLVNCLQTLENIVSVTP